MAVLILLAALIGSWALMAYVMKTLEKEKLQLLQQVQGLRRRLVEEPAAVDLISALKHPTQGTVATEEGLRQLLQSVQEQHPEFFSSHPELVRSLSDVARGLRQTQVAAKMSVANDDRALSVLLQTLGRPVAETAATTTPEAAAPPTSPDPEKPASDDNPLACAFDRAAAAAQRSATFGESSRSRSKM